MFTASKLGYFVIDSYDGLIEEIVRVKPRVVKSGHPGFLRQLREALGTNYGTLLIGRDFGQVDDMARWDSGRVLSDPIGAAAYWVEAYRQAMEEVPGVYWESFNEMSNFAWMPQYGLFEAERVRLMHEEGFLACIGNFSVGNPPIRPDTNDPWEHFYPALEAADKYGALLGLHEYGGLYMDMFYGPNQRDSMLAGNHSLMPLTYAEGWLFGRYRKVWNTHIQPNGWTRIRIVLTELGIDRVATDVTDTLVGYIVGPWTQCQRYWAEHDHRPDGATFYAEQLKWADFQMQRDSYVAGATIFCNGAQSDVWRQWDVRGEVSRQLNEHIMSLLLTDKKVVDSRAVTLRDKPGGQALSTLFFGDIVTAEETEDAEWMYVITESGLSGYVSILWLSDL